MIKLDFKILAQEIGGKLINERFGSVAFEGVSIDSRTIKQAELFIAIKGENDDGHKYVNDALESKSAGLIVEWDYPGIAAISEKVPIVTVDDTHQSMMLLAASYRKKLTAEFVGISGSNGKTTTKDIAYSIMRSKDDKSYRSSGNLNNLFGLPLAIFGMPSDSHYGVFELGISVPGEMARLAEIVKPDLALVTNVGPTHLETLGSVENVAETKLELVDALERHKPVLINADDPILMKAAAKRDREIITYAVETPADFTAERLGMNAEGLPLARIDGQQVTVGLFGAHQIYNLLAGYAICRVLGLNIKAEELNNIDYAFAPYRGEIKHCEERTIIADCYNANPVSMESGLKSFKQYVADPALRDRRAVVVVGDMLELGVKSEEYHRNIGRLIADCGFDLVIVVGPLSAEIRKAAVDADFNPDKIIHYASSEKAREALVNNIQRGDIVYFKASRGIGLEKLLYC